MVALPLELLNKIRESSDTMTVTVVIDRAIRHQKATSDNQQLIGSRRNSMRSRWSGCMDINPSLVEEQRPPVLSHRRPSIDTMFSTSHHDQHNCCHPSLDGTMSLAAQVIVPFPTRKLPGDNSPRLPNRMRGIASTFCCPPPSISPVTSPPPPPKSLSDNSPRLPKRESSLKSPQHSKLVLNKYGGTSEILDEALKLVSPEQGGSSGSTSPTAKTTKATTTTTATTTLERQL